MELQVEIISKEIIKPSTLTPLHHKRYILSLLDQLTPLVYGFQFSCYEPPNDYIDGPKTVARLKQSLSQTLSIFYFLAGRLNADESSINCNDEGVPFVEATCNVTLSSFLNDPNRVDLITYFLPNVISTSTSGCDELKTCISRSLTATELVPIAVQVTIFECGGVMIVIKGLHKIFDAASWGTFTKIWSDLTMIKKNLPLPDPLEDDTDMNFMIPKPDFTSAASLFPPCNWAKVSPPRAPVPLCDLDGNKMDGTCVVKVFEFSPESISALQTKARSHLVPTPSRVEAVSGFIWKHAMIATAMASGNPDVIGPSSITHAINMRSRTNPKLSPTAVGNLVFHAIGHYTSQVDEGGKSMPELSNLVAEIWRALAQGKDAEFLSKFQGEDGGQEILRYKQKLAQLKEDASMSFYRFTSWVRLGMDQEFGLGMPVWSGHRGGRMSSWFRNLIHLIMNPSRGIEVWWIMDEKEMECLQSIPEFLEFASPNHI